MTLYCHRRLLSLGCLRGTAVRVPVSPRWRHSTGTEEIGCSEDPNEVSQLVLLLGSARWGFNEESLLLRSEECHKKGQKRK